MISNHQRGPKAEIRGFAKDDGGVRHIGRDFGTAIGKVQAAGDEFAAFDAVGRLAQAAVSLQRSSTSCSVSTARQAEASRLFGGNAIGGGFGPDRTDVAQAINEVVFDAAARDRSGEMTVAADGEQRTFGTRRTTLGLDDGGKSSGYAGFDPAGSAAQDSGIDAIHQQFSQSLLNSLRASTGMTWRR